jgi:hypothetical protein
MIDQMIDLWPFLSNTPPNLPAGREQAVPAASLLTSITSSYIKDREA